MCVLNAGTRPRFPGFRGRLPYLTCLTSGRPSGTVARRPPFQILKARSVPKSLHPFAGAMPSPAPAEAPGGEPPPRDDAGIAPESRRNRIGWRQEPSTLSPGGETMNARILFNRRRWSVVLAAALALPLAVRAADTTPPKLEIRGAAILSHPCGKVAVKHMGLVHAGKMDEATKLGTPEMQAQWKALPEKERAMMSDMMKATSTTEAEFSA